MSKTRLQLVWPNKDKRLLTHGVDTYEWVDPQDWRATEVRLLEPIEDVGDVAAGNLVVQGDALHALTSLTQLPELRAEYLGKVKLCYIDPPFNTDQAFLHYNDSVEHSVWLTMMRDRLVQIRQLLSDDGSVWVHLDDVEVHRMRAVLDEVMGPENFVTTIVWQKKTSRDNRASFSSTHDYIIVYSKTRGWRDVRNRLPDGGAYTNPDKDPRGPWRSVPMTAQAGRATADQFYTVTTPTGAQHDPPPGRAWTYTDRRFQELVAANNVYWPKGGAGKPRLKMFPWQSKGLVPFTIWSASEVGDNPEAVKELRALLGADATFDTPKPERLLERIIHIGSNPGDIVLDCFAGSATTAGRHAGGTG